MQQVHPLPLPLPETRLHDEVTDLFTERVSVQPHGLAIDAWEVIIRRLDGVLVTLMRGVTETEARRIAARAREALLNDEPWILHLIDISAGALRG